MCFQSPPFWCLVTIQEFAVLRHNMMISIEKELLQHLQNIDGLRLEVCTQLGSKLPLDFTNQATSARY